MLTNYFFVTHTSNVKKFWLFLFELHIGSQCHTQMRPQKSCLEDCKFLILSLLDK